MLRLTETPSGKRHQLLIEYIQKEVGEIIGLNPGQSVDPSVGFFDLGIDSLMTVGLKNRLETALGCSLPATMAFDYPSIHDLTHYLLSQVLALIEPQDSGNIEQANDSEEQDTLIAHVTSLSDKELEQMLNNELDQLSGD